jgi:hypothetical protein
MGTLDVFALGRMSDEPHGALMQRIRARAQEYESVISVAAIACNYDVNESVMMCRAATARVLLGVVLRYKCRRLVLTVGSGAPSALRNRLLGLATSFNEALRLGGQSARVVVRLGDELCFSFPRYGVLHVAQT